MPLLKNLLLEDSLQAEEIIPEPSGLKLNEIQDKLKLAIPALATPSDEDRVRELLEEKGAGLERSVGVLSEIMNYGSSDDAIRLRATELSLKLHRVLRDDNSRGAYNFAFVIKGEDVNIQAILQPERPL